MVVKGALFGPAGRYLRRLSPSYLMMTFIRQRIHVAIQRVYKSRYSEARIFLRTALAPVPVANATAIVILMYRYL